MLTSNLKSSDFNSICIDAFKSAASGSGIGAGASFIGLLFAYVINKKTGGGIIYKQCHRVTVTQATLLHETRMNLYINGVRSIGSCLKHNLQLFIPTGSDLVISFFLTWIIGSAYCSNNYASIKKEITNKASFDKYCELPDGQLPQQADYKFDGSNACSNQDFVLLPLVFTAAVGIVVNPIIATSLSAYMRTGGTLCPPNEFRDYNVGDVIDVHCSGNAVFFTELVTTFVITGIDTVVTGALNTLFICSPVCEVN